MTVIDNGVYSGPSTRESRATCCAIRVSLFFSVGGWTHLQHIIRGGFSMRRVFILALLVVAAVASWAGAQDEEGVERIITITTAAMQGPDYDVIYDAMRAKYPNLRIRTIGLNSADGSTIPQDALIGAGIYPNVMGGFTGRTCKYMIQSEEGWTVQDLRPLMSAADLRDFLDLEPWTVDGKILGLPAVIPAQAMILNLELLDAAGWEYPGDPWTVAQFGEMCEAVKKVGKWGTIGFAKNASADYLYMQWVGAFGAQLFAEGDYTKTVIDSPEGLAVFEFWDSWIDNGWAPPESVDLWDDAAIEYFQKGEVAAMGFRNDWTDGYMNSAITNQWIDEPFRTMMVPFPVAPGVKGAPSVGAGSTYLAYESGDPEVDAIAAEILLLTTGSARQSTQVTNTGQFASRSSAAGTPTFAKAHLPELIPQYLKDWNVVKDIITEFGMLDVGYTLPMYYPIRAAMFPRLQGMWTGTETAAEALATYAAEVNELLSQ